MRTRGAGWRYPRCAQITCSGFPDRTGVPDWFRRVRPAGTILAASARPILTVRLVDPPPLPGQAVGADPAQRGLQVRYHFLRADHPDRLAGPGCVRSELAAACRRGDEGAVLSHRVHTSDDYLGG